MASDQHMMEILSDMLRDGETLFYPIFGTIKRGSFQFFAYFAFTETHLLIAYLTSGNVVSDVQRIPLDIKSLKVKKTKLLNEYKIHILSDNQKEFEISAFLKILKIKSQKNNLPLFLEYLKSKSKRQAKSLDEIGGIKIRWQYFNTYIYMILAIIPAVPVMIIMGQLRKGNFDIWNVVLEMSGAVPGMFAMYGFFIGPFVVLSFLNRFLFGKLLGVATEDTLFLENHEIPMTDIKEIVYHPRIVSRHSISFSYATIFVRIKANNMEPLHVVHFPLYGLRKIQKYNKEIKLSCDRYLWFWVLCPTVLSAVIGFLLG